MSFVLATVLRFTSAALAQAAPNTCLLVTVPVPDAVSTASLAASGIKVLLLSRGAVGTSSSADGTASIDFSPDVYISLGTTLVHQHPTFAMRQILDLDITQYFFPLLPNLRKAYNYFTPDIGYKKTRMLCIFFGFI